MAARNRSHPGTGDAETDELLEQLLDRAGASTNRDLLFDILATGTRLASEDVERLDLKITSAALAEMAEAFRVFSPYRDRLKVTMFGSARTLPADPLYAQARELAHELAARGWMVVTGAGPGIMAAGLEGAGRDMAFGINIRLPFEQGANEFIARDPKLVTMKYFFTRKLMLMKESDGFVVLPGGFGTLDEAFELLTLLQTGKAMPAPLVLLEVPDGSFWQSWTAFLTNEVEPRGLISPDDQHLWRVTDDVAEAAEEITGFYRNYHSVRWVGRRLVIRLQHAPTNDELDELNETFADICSQGVIERTEPLAAELAGQDHLELSRLVLYFDHNHHGRLRQLINAANTWESLPPAGGPSSAGSPRST